MPDTLKDQISKYADYFILASDFTTSNAVRFFTNVSLAFKLDYTLRRMHKIDPITLNIGVRSGWVKWDESFDMDAQPFKLCVKHKMCPKRGVTFYCNINRKDVLMSFILREGVAFSEEVKTELSFLGMSLYGNPNLGLVEVLTDRQCEILRLSGKGLEVKQIAGTFDVTETAIRNQKNAIVKKLNAKNFHEALVFAAQDGLFDDDSEAIGG